MNKKYSKFIKLSAFIFMGLMQANEVKAFNLAEAHRACIRGQGCAAYQNAPHYGSGSRAFDVCQTNGCKKACLQAGQYCSDPYDPPDYCAVCGEQ